ncbi:hypothetical protein HU200_032802 [Digitaria exilis]|uniref:Uncharacterized protein n=1 Tax=Digitaria exilis TaxID=1010633 RepID=A0A835BMH6_9POAL|nr:hypothetical protein HU200_032802 [Digitaria exilis]
MELSKKTRLDLSSTAEPVKPFDKPEARAPEDIPAGKVPSTEKSQVPPTSLTGNFVHSTGVDIPLKPANSDTAAHRLLVETKKGARPSKTTDHTKQQGGLPQGSYVIGGSPIGWNFLMWPGCKAVFYGLTKAEWNFRVNRCRFDVYLVLIGCFAGSTWALSETFMVSTANLWNFYCFDSGDPGILRLIRRDPGDNEGLRVRDQCKFYFLPFIMFSLDSGYHRAVEDEYYDQDEYEEDGSGAGDEYVEEEEPSEGQKEILELRERLKEQIRRKAKAAAASAAGRSSSFHDRILPTRFGSFFGPSKPVISRRVIEERKSLKELHSTISRDPRPSAVHRDMPSSSKVQNKVNGHHHKPKVVNEVKRKAEALKDNRDYSFLLSDDADLSSSPKEKNAARSSLSQRADREVMHSAAKSKAPTSQPAARLSNGYNTSSTKRHAEGMVGFMRKEVLSNRERAVSRDNERMHSIVRNGSNQTSTSKITSQKLPTKVPIVNRHPSKDLNDSALRKSIVASRHEIDRPKSSQSQRVQPAGQRPQISSHGQRPHQSAQQRPQQSLQSRRPQQVSQGQRPQQSLQSQRTQQSLQNQRPQQSSHAPKLQSSHTHRPQLQSNRSQSLQGQRPLSSQGQYSEQRRVQADDRVKQIERQIRPPSKPMPSRPISSNGIRDDHAKRKQVVKRRFDDDEDDEDPLAMIRNMFGVARLSKPSIARLLWQFQNVAQR